MNTYPGSSHSPHVHCHQQSLPTSHPGLHSHLSGLCLFQPQCLAQPPVGRGESGRVHLGWLEEEKIKKQGSNQEALEVLPWWDQDEGAEWVDPSSYRGDSIGFPGKRWHRKGGERPGAEVGAWKLGALLLWESWKSQKKSGFQVADSGQPCGPWEGGEQLHIVPIALRVHFMSGANSHLDDEPLGARTPSPKTWHP